MFGRTYTKVAFAIKFCKNDRKEMPQFRTLDDDTDWEVGRNQEPPSDKQLNC